MVPSAVIGIACGNLVQTRKANQFSVESYRRKGKIHISSFRISHIVCSCHDKFAFGCS